MRHGPRRPAGCLPLHPRVANRNPVATYEANIQGTWAVLEAVRSSHVHPSAEDILGVVRSTSPGCSRRVPETSTVLTSNPGSAGSTRGVATISAVTPTAARPDRARRWALRMPLLRLRSRERCVQLPRRVVQVPRPEREAEIAGPKDLPQVVDELGPPGHVGHLVPRVLLEHGIDERLRQGAGQVAGAYLGLELGDRCRRVGALRRQASRWRDRRGNVDLGASFRAFVGRRAEMAAIQTAFITTG